MACHLKPILDYALGLCFGNLKLSKTREKTVFTSENVRKTQENYQTREKRKKSFVYYTTHWVKMQEKIKNARKISKTQVKHCIV